MVPFSPFGAATISRALAPGIIEYLLQLSKADGADRTRANDAGTDPLRNGEPNGELGMVIQSDFAWQEQTGDRGRPEPGNANGTAENPRHFNGARPGFAINSGQLQCGGACLPTKLGGDAAAVFDVDEWLPTYLSDVMRPQSTGLKFSLNLCWDFQALTISKFACDVY